MTPPNRPDRSPRERRSTHDRSPRERSSSRGERGERSPARGEHASRESARTASRDEQKLRTRRALLDAALNLLAGERSFSSLSLREVAREAGVVPTAFYRHFPDMEALGLALVDESIAALRELMRDARSAKAPTLQLVQRSVETFLAYVRVHPLHFRFLAKERFSGSSTLRFAIRAEIRLFTSELATDLARTPALSHITTDDLQMIAALGVQSVIAALELVLDVRPGDEAEFTRIQEQVEDQLLLILFGAGQWRGHRHRPRPGPPGADFV